MLRGMKLGKRELDGKIETLLLAVLAEGPGHGYGLVQKLNERSAGLLSLGEGTVYPVLHRMEEQGLLTAAWRTGDTGRQRKVYRLSPKGRRRLNTQRQQWAGLVSVMDKIVGPVAEGDSPLNPRGATA